MLQNPDSEFGIWSVEMFFSYCSIGVRFLKEQPIPKYFHFPFIVNIRSTSIPRKYLKIFSSDIISCFINIHQNYELFASTANKNVCQCLINVPFGFLSPCHAIWWNRPRSYVVYAIHQQVASVLVKVNSCDVLIHKDGLFDVILTFTSAKVTNHYIK